MRARANPALNIVNFLKMIVNSQVANQRATIRVVDVILFDTVAIIKAELTGHLVHRITGRKDLPDYLRGDVTLAPLLVRSAFTLGPTKHDHHVGSLTSTGLTLHWIPEQIPGNKDIGLLTEDRVESTLDRHDPAELPGVIGHRLAIAFRIDNRRSGIGSGNNAHGNLQTTSARRAYAVAKAQTHQPGLTYRRPGSSCRARCRSSRSPHARWPGSRGSAGSGQCRR